MTAHGSSITSSGSFNPSPHQDRQDPVLLPRSSEQPLGTPTITTSSPDVQALLSGALLHQEERSAMADTPKSTIIPISPEQPSDEPLEPTATNTTTTTTATAANVLTLETQLKEQRSRSRQLLVLKTGSFFILPSVLPYLASSLVAHFTLEKNPESMMATSPTDTVAVARGGEGGVVPWWVVPWIPFVGLMIPIALASALNTIQDCRANPTKTTTRTAAKQQETRCPYERLKRFMSARWTARSCDGPSRLLSLEEEEYKVDGDGGITGWGLYHLESRSATAARNQSPRWVPRSRTLLRVSLCAWIVLLASAPHLGLNQPETLVSVRAGERSISQGNSGGSGDSIMKEEENSPFASILRSSSPNPPIEHSNSWDDVKQQRQRQQQEELEAMVQAAEEDDVMDSEWVYPSPGMDDPWDDSSALRDLLDTPEDLAATNEMETLKEEEQEHQQQQQPEEYIIRLFKYVPLWTEVFMFLLAICLGGMSVGLDQVKNQIHSSQTELEQQLQDELLRSHQHENSAQARAHILETMRIDDQRQGHAVWTWACGTLVVMALGLNYWLVISLCHWNIPSLYFVGLGCAGMLLVNSWVLENETGEDTVVASRSEGGRSYYYAYYGNEKTERY